MFVQSIRAFIIVAMSLTVIAGCERPISNSPTVGTVDLKVDFGSANKSSLTMAVPCSADSTVLSILDRAQNIGDLKFKSSGTGERAFVQSIDGVSNEGDSGSNWIYSVDGETGKTGAGVAKVAPQQAVEWKFGDLPADMKYAPDSPEF